MVFERKTIISKKVFQILEETHRALSLKQIMGVLKISGLDPNKTTVYRILDKLVTKKIVSLIAVNNGVSYFEWVKDKHGHHHHFFCNTCHTLFCLDACHVETHNIDLSGLLPNKEFQITAHEFNLYGVCKPCQQ